MKVIIQRTATSQILQIFIQDSSSTTGAGLAGLVYNSAGLKCYFKRNPEASATVVNLVDSTVGTYTSSGFKEIDATNMPGWYQLCIPNAALDTGSPIPRYCAIHLMGATNMAPCPIEIELTGCDLNNNQTLGISAFPAANAGAVGGLPTVDANNAVKVQSGTGANQISLSSGTVTVGTNNDKTGYTASTVSDKTGYSLAASQTFNVTGNITGNVTGSVGSVTTVSDKTGYSLAASQTFNMTGNVTGNLSGSVGSVTSPVTAGTVSDKTGYTLSAAYDAAKTAAQAGDAMTLTAAYDAAKTAAQVGSAMTLDLTQAIPATNTAQTMGDALNAARAQGFGKWVLSGTTLTLYAANGTTVVRTFTLDSATAPTSRT